MTHWKLLCLLRALTNSPLNHFTGDTLTLCTRKTSLISSLQNPHLCGVREEARGGGGGSSAGSSSRLGEQKRVKNEGRIRINSGRRWLHFFGCQLRCRATAWYHCIFSFSIRLQLKMKYMGMDPRKNWKYKESNGKWISSKWKCPSTKYCCEVVLLYIALSWNKLLFVTKRR